jgi:hypothetical protein
MKWFAATVLVLALSGAIAGPARAQAAEDSEDELGTWLIWNGTVRFSERWSMFTEAQVRLWEVASNLNEWFVRAAGHYDLSEKAMVGLGIMYDETTPFEDGPEGSENRIYEQFTIKHGWARTGFEHRYRLEQRWLEEAGESEFSSRFRYRLQVTTPLNRETMEPGAWFTNFYDEIFLNFDSERTFDQNRLYGAVGRQFTPTSNLQLGVLWQARTSTDFLRLQVFYTHNFNLHER